MNSRTGISTTGACLLVLLLAPGAWSLAQDLGPDSVPNSRLQDDEAPEIRLSDLMEVEYKRGKALPAEITAYEGQTVKITGLMALGTPEGEETFQLVNDACGCGQSKVQHFVEVTMPEGDLTQYTPEEITVTGVFEASEKFEDGFVVSVWRLKATKIVKNDRG